MNEYQEIPLKSICCTCLSRDRKLYQLCRIPDGVNNLYCLLSADSEAYKEGFYKDTASLFICWECRAILRKINQFRHQACEAQKQLCIVPNGLVEIKSLSKCLSCLSCHYKKVNDYSFTFRSDNLSCDNFVDCGLVDAVIKTECDVDDIPLSELHNINNKNDNSCDSEAVCEKSNIDYEEKINDTKKYQNKSSHLKKEICFKVKKKTKMKSTDKCNDINSYNKKYFRVISMIETEILEVVKQQKSAAEYCKAKFQCEYCIKGFKSKPEIEKHYLSVHTKKDKHTQCDICLQYIKDSLLGNHKLQHSLKYNCLLCEHIAYSIPDVMKHLEEYHTVNDWCEDIEIKTERKPPKVLKPGSKPRRNQAMMDKRTPFGYLCTECNKYFDNKNQRWKHIQRHHREGFKCDTCGKRFAFKNNLSRHELVHQGPLPREKCQTCHKMIRVDLMAIHSRIHAHREQFWCAECDKTFVSRASYEHHLKYTQAHALVDVLKYKCRVCDKGYRSRGELRDHENYQHMGKTRHKCPVCGKALATRRCITRHVRRAHHGVKENARDKICQQCGKAFRDKKGLREHEFIHTGERPLSCEMCGCTFRQSASLYTHRKRVHKIYPQRKSVQLLDIETTPSESLK